MNEENPGTAGSDEGTASTTRIGTAERDVALERLLEHWQAGRLDPTEHELRVTRAKAAVTQADLDVLFADLPQAGPAQATTDAVLTPSSRGFLDGKRETIMALAPFAALVLFFTTHSWLWFLMVPAMGILMYGAGGDSGEHKNPPEYGR
jgi:hypothetical protein